MTPTTEELVERVRKWLPHPTGTIAENPENPHVALTTLSERLQAAEARLERSLNWREYDAALTTRAEAAEQRVAELVAEGEILRAELRDQCARIAELKEALRELDAWASRMPDAGFNDQDPRWSWWHERPRAALEAKERENVYVTDPRDMDFIRKERE